MAITETITSGSNRVTQHGLLIGGQWVEPVDGSSYRLTSPVTGREIAEIAAGGPEDVERAVQAAATAFYENEFRTNFERAQWCDRIADTIDSRRDHLAEELVLEHGKPIGEAKAEVSSAAMGFRLAAEEGRRLVGETLPVNDVHKRVMTIRRPLGVWAVFTPWNFPANIPVEYLGPAIASGNTVVWKPASSTARIAVRLAECIADSDIPTGVVNLVTGPAARIASHLIHQVDVVGVGFTGSSAVGRAVAADAAGKYVVLELGGNGPVIVLGDADLERAVPAVGSAAFWNAGQSCTAAERIIAEPGAYEELTAGLRNVAKGIRLGDPRDSATTMGPVHGESTAEKMDEHIADAVRQGAEILAGGVRREGAPTRLYYEPTVLASVPPSALVHQEETFGPIAPVTEVSGDEAILEVCAASKLGLSAAIFTRDIARGIRLAERLTNGQVIINDTSNYWELHMPFGGSPRTDSGIGRLGGKYMLHAMTQIKSISVDVS